MSSSISASPMEFLCLREVEYYGMTPYAVVDAIGQIIVQEVQNTFSKSAEQLHRHITFLSQAQIQTVSGNRLIISPSRAWIVGMELSATYTHACLINLRHT